MSSPAPDLLTFWRGYLEGARGRDTVPLDRWPELSASSIPARFDHPFHPSTAEALASLAARYAAAPGTVVLALWLGWLHRATHEADLLVAGYASADARPEDAAPLRFQISSGTTLSGLVATAHEAISHGGSWLRLPAGERGRLWSLLAPPGPESSARVGFSFSSESEPPASALGLALRPLGLSFVYDGRRYQAAALPWLGRQLEYAISSLTARPEATVASLEFSDPAEQTLLRAWARGAIPTTEVRDLSLRFARRVAAHPNALVVVSTEATLTFAQLDTRANRLGNFLRSAGVGPDQTVALCLARSADLVTTILAVFKAGGAVFMLDPSAPVERQARLLTLTRPRIVISDLATRHLLPPTTVPVLTLDDAPSPWLAASPEAIPHRCAAQHRAILFQTSGSTGEPKIVVELYGHWRAAPISNEGDVFLLKSNAGTTFSLAEAMAVLSGFTVCIAPPGLEQDLPALAEFMADQGVTHAAFTPSALRLLLAGAPPRWVEGLKSVTCIGERVPADLKRAFATRFPRTRLVIGYGCTEARGATSRVCAETDDPGLVDVGRPGAGMEAWVLDGEGRPCPVGLPGEIHLGGQLAESYLDDPAATAASFVAHPFDPRPGSRLFRTRDLGRYLPDGTLEVRGRLDHQVKIRGYRIETGEIEAALLRLEGIGAAAVLRREDAPDQERLVAYLAPTGKTQPTALEVGEIRRALAQTLPAYMVPAEFVCLAKLPMTSTGKIDRRALPAPAAPPARSLRPEDQPINDLERRLLGHWEQLFQRRPLGRHDDFFELGGHSLLAARFVTLAAADLGRRLPAAWLFQAPTVARLVAKVGGSAAAGTAEGSSLVCLQGRGEEAPLFVVHGWGGEVFAYLDLARALAPRRPTYGLQAVGLDGLSPRHTTLEEMARHYVKELRTVQTNGPYHLLGYSTGGWIAFAVAQELHRQGETVALLGMLETGRMARLPPQAEFMAVGKHLGKRLLHHVRNVGAYFRAGGGQRFKQACAVLRLHLTGAHRKGLPGEPGKTKPAGAEYFEVDYYAALVGRYHAKPHPGRLALFLGVGAKAESFRFWRHLFGDRIDSYRVPGAHHTLLSEAHVPEFARVLEEAMGGKSGKAEKRKF